jgi:hypothetical protein
VGAPPQIGEKTAIRLACLENDAADQHPLARTTAEDGEKINGP